MELNDHSLRQMDENDIRKLPEAALRDLAVKLLQDLKEAMQLQKHWNNSNQTSLSMAISMKQQELKSSLETQEY